MYDGSDVHETVLTLLALEAAGEKPTLIAPDIVQDRTVDHLTGEEVEGERRGVLRESARLGRGPTRSLSDLRPDDLEALIIPGGYGPVVNFSTGFARRGQPHALIAEIERFIRHFLHDGKPIGLVSLGEIPIRMILGQEMEMPAPPHDPRRLSVDQARRIVHTPGFSVFTRLQDVQAGIEAMVGEVLKLMEERRVAPAGGTP
jgi:enhancing lycopene biosynthesis protein 2